MSTSFRIALFPDNRVANPAPGNRAARFFDGVRFFDEARAENIVQHPGLVKVYDFGQLASGDRKGDAGRGGVCSHAGFITARAQASGVKAKAAPAPGRASTSAPPPGGDIPILR